MVFRSKFDSRRWGSCPRNPTYLVESMASTLRGMRSPWVGSAVFCAGASSSTGRIRTRPATLGLTVHRHCYRRDAGLEASPEAGDESELENGESEDSPFG